MTSPRRPRAARHAARRRRSRAAAATVSGGEALRRGEGPSVLAGSRRGVLLGAGLSMVALATAWLGVGSAPVGAAGAATGVATAQEPFRVEVDLAQPGVAANRRLLGHNVQWVDRGDDLLGEDGRMDERMLAQARALGPTVLRFPGGAQSDVYHWQRGIGPLAQRGENEHFHARRTQPSVMGTAEFLALCAATGAEPLVTVNVPTGTPDEAARWVHATNVVGFRAADGERLPGVRWWEIGNEPYLKDEAQPALALEPEAYARRADAIIRAMRAVDPSIQVGLPVSSPRRNGIPVVHYPDWLDRVLATLTEPVDFAAVHDGYMPFVQETLGNAATQRELAWWAAMASARAVQQDWQALRERLGRWRPGRPLPLALTEYHAIFSLGQGARDEWTGSPAGALYVADLLRAASLQPDLLMAHLWSLSGNWRFGAIHSQGFARPVAQVLAVMNTWLQGRVLPTAVTCGTVATPRAGLAAAQPALPLVEGLATLAAGTSPGRATLRLLALHKHPRRPISGALHVAGGQVGTVRLQQLTAPDPMRSDDVPGLFEQRRQVLAPADLARLWLPPASLTLLELDVVLPPGRPGSVAVALAAP